MYKESSTITYSEAVTKCDSTYNSPKLASILSNTDNNTVTT